jgi:hypothetical protein
VHLSNAEIILWYSSLVLELTLCVLALWRHLYRLLPVFTAYVTALFVREAVMYCIYHTAGYTSRLAFYSFWITQAILVVGRGLAIGELAWSASRLYPGLRAVLKWGLAGVASAFLILATIIATTNAPELPSLILGLQRDLDLTALVVLVALFTIGRLYQVGLAFPQSLIAIGFLAYSVIQVVNNSISKEWLQSYFHGWVIVWVAASQIAAVLWLVALIRPLALQVTPQPVEDIEALRTLVHEGNQVLRNVSARLTRFRKTLKNSGRRY